MLYDISLLLAMLGLLRAMMPLIKQQGVVMSGWKVLLFLALLLWPFILGPLFWKYVVGMTFSRTVFLAGSILSFLLVFNSAMWLLPGRGLVLGADTESVMAAASKCGLEGSYGDVPGFDNESKEGVQAELSETATREWLARPHFLGTLVQMAGAKSLSLLEEHLGDVELSWRMKAGGFLAAIIALALLVASLVSILRRLGPLW